MKSLRMNFQKKTIFGKTYKMAHGRLKETVKFYQWLNNLEKVSLSDIFYDYFVNK